MQITATLKGRDEDLIQQVSDSSNLPVSELIRIGLRKIFKEIEENGNFVIPTNLSENQNEEAVWLP